MAGNLKSAAVHILGESWGSGLCKQNTNKIQTTMLYLKRVKKGARESRVHGKGELKRMENGEEMLLWVLVRQHGTIIGFGGCWDLERLKSE